MVSNEEIVRNFIKAWSRLDVNELVDFFASDGVYHNMPLAPVAGRDNLRGFIAAFLKSWTATQWDILNLVSHGDVVIAERVDRTTVGGKSVTLPCCGVFEMKDGKIKTWRDYFDMATYTKALAG
ncbi:MAG: nuclear transport factor 2 family protein [Proteobacteria bacterium]|nr:nuclear transport factor 2 family protein [Pseudomonadota bacterium]